MTRLRQCWPKRLLHQLSLLLCLALVASHLIGIVLLHHHGSLLHPLSRNASLERLATAYHAARDLPPGQSSKLLAHMGNRETRFWVARQPEVEPFSPRAEEQRLANDLRSRLALPAENSLTLQLERANGANARSHLLSPAGWAPLQLRSSLAIGNGLFLNAIQHPSGAYQWGSVLAYSLPVTTLPVLLVVVFCISRVLRPVKSLARATERVSRGEWIAPLPLAGPAEARELTHAFNTPLTELRLQVELLEPGEARDDMLESLEELATMLRETLGFVRDDAVQEPTRRIAIEMLLGELTRRYGMLGHTLTLGKRADVYLYCRPLALKRALTNLIDNALKHGGTAQVDVNVQAGMIVLEILDQGPGLPEAWLEKVFEPFVQLGHGNGGLGLGLAISRACVQAHGGELVLENRQPTGLCAVLKLPQSLEDPKCLV